MTSVNRSAIVPYSAHEMFVLVAAIDSYADFLPWCGSAKILSRDQDVVEAAIVIAYKGIHKEFITRNRLHQDKMMEIRLVRGPFRELHGYWYFEDLDPKASKISVDLEFDFSNKLVGLLVGPVFEYIANTLVENFHLRAVEIYGER